MNYWLFKSEPDAWSWDQQKKEGAHGGEWDGVRNYQARNVMRAMKKGDLGFFYHSGEEKRIVGVVKVVAEAHPEFDRRDRGLGVRRRRRNLRREEAGDACRDQGEQGAQGHGAGQQFEALGAAGLGRRVEYHQPDCRT